MPVTEFRHPAQCLAVASCALVARLRCGLAGAALAVLVILLAAGTTPGLAQSAAASPPCGAPPVPAYPPLGAPPVVLTGTGSGLPASLDVNACIHWDARAMSLVVLLSGRLRDADGVADLLARFGAISRRANMPYWSATDRRMQPLVTGATAVTGPDGETHRGDFSPAELADGAPHYFVQDDNRSTGEVTYAIRTLQVTADRLVLTVENTTPVKSYFISLFDPGDLRVTYYLDRLGPDSWGFYSISGIQESSVTGGHRDSYASRAIAEFNHIAAMTR